MNFGSGLVPEGCGFALQVTANFEANSEEAANRMVHQGIA